MLADGVEVGEVLVGVLIGVGVAGPEVAGGTELEEDKVEWLTEEGLEEEDKDKEDEGVPGLDVDEGVTGDVVGAMT